MINKFIFNFYYKKLNKIDGKIVETKKYSLIIETFETSKLGIVADNVIEPTTQHRIILYSFSLN